MTREGRGWLDNVLIGVGTMSAAYSGGQAVNSNEVSAAAVLGVLVGTAFSAFVARRLDGKKILVADGFLYAAFAIFAFFGGRWLNGVFPPEVFPRELMPSAWLLWLLTFGSFFLWRDSTLLFQNVPALALFGFVGCYDTFAPVVFFFYLYLVCAATLFARAQARSMAARAERSGFFGDDLESLRRDGAILSRLRAGPWRWVAGPDRALASAAAIILMSFLGAPVLRQTVKPISGFVKVTSPSGQRPAAAASTGAAESSGGTVRIARGPVRLRNTPAYESSVTSESYFQTETFMNYTAGVWRRGVSPSRDTSEPRRNDPRLTAYLLPDGSKVMGPAPEGDRQKGGVLRAYPIQITYRVMSDSLPVPGRAFRADSPELVSFERRNLREIGFVANLLYEPIPRLRGSEEAEIGVTPYDFAALAKEGTPRIEEWAQAQAGKGVAAERAERLRAAISRTIQYDINASAPDPGQDPVERALFDKKVGYCDVFASAMVLGARAIGIPARYAIGYYGDPRSVTEDGTLVLLESDAHAWAELHFEGVGWVPFDATGGAQVVPGGGRRDAGASDNVFSLANIRLLLVSGGVLLLVAGAAFLLWPRRKGVAPTNRERDAAIALFSRTLADRRGASRREGETLAEHFDAAVPHLGEHRAEGDRLLKSIEQELYGAELAPTTTLPTEVAAFRNKLKREARKR